MKILKKSSNHTKAINDIRKYENALDQRRTLPHNVLAPIQEKLMLNHPAVDISKAWLGDRLKSYKDYDRLGIFKENGRKGIAEVRGQLAVSTLEQVLGVQSTVDHNNNGGKDDDNIEEEEKEESLVFFGSYRAAHSRIKKHKRGANSKFIKQLDAPEHDHVSITNEHRSSRTCPVCHSPTKHQKFRRDNKLKSVNGALRCTNPHCPAHN